MITSKSLDSHNFFLTLLKSSQTFQQVPLSIYSLFSVFERSHRDYV